MSLALPIDSSLDKIVQAVANNPIAIVNAPPGSGKTTRVAPALLHSSAAESNQRIYLLQPRRIAARSVAARIANENGWQLGREVGYHVRFERNFGRDTRLIVATEGVLLRRLQDDPTLGDTSIVLLDEFHERSLDADLLLGMLREVQATVREDLRIVIMSATLDCEALGKELTGAPMISVAGRMFPVAIRHRPPRFQQSIVEATAESVLDCVTKHAGDVLVFLPGQGEIHRVRDLIKRDNQLRDVDVYPLYGSLPLDEQTKIIQPGLKRKVVLATNVAETSLTIEGIQVVIDSGQARVMRFEPSVGLDRLNLEPIAKDSATQRTGRAGRVCEGTCYRLWDEASHRSRSEHLEPEVRRVDLSGAVLQLFYWGQSNVMEFPWVTAPREESVTAATKLLERLGAIKKSRITELGQQLARLPLHPRLGRMVVDGFHRGHLSSVALAAAMLSERDPFQNRDSRDRTSGSKSMHTAQSRKWTSDVAMRVELLEEFYRGGSNDPVLGEIHRGTAQVIRQTARDIEKQAMSLFEESNLVDARAGISVGSSSEEAIQRAILAGFPDRLAKRRAPGKNSAVMVGGRAVQLAPSSGVHDADLFICVDVDGRGTDATVRQASEIDESWLDVELIQERDELFFHPTQQQVVARRRILWDDLVLAETPVAIEDRVEAAQILHAAAVDAWHAVFPADDKELQSLIQRCQWLRSVAPEIDLPDFSPTALSQICLEMCEHHRSFSELKKARWYDWVVSKFSSPQLQSLNREAPERINVPSGSSIRLEYELGKSPVLAVKIQEVFSWTSTPRLAMGRVPILFHLLAPNMRPQQITDDLESFWSVGYAMVKKDLKRRYPKHSWPEDPTKALPSKR
ncbi:MAG: ATP-dependent helicase HrpB [Pirellulaceae bacterium]|nr:ATP-dependent helicase HrpB [Pirellulaceae bacterium]